VSKPHVAVVIKGNNLPLSGRRWGAYKTACNELALKRTQSQRHHDRKELKAGGTLHMDGYAVRKCD
jgi:hypothetical protein